MHNDEFKLDKRRVRRSFNQAARTYDAAAVLQREIGDRLIARLDLIKQTPTHVLDAGAGTGYCTRALARRYRKAQVYALDIAHAPLSAAKSQAGWFSHSRFVCGDAEQLPIANEAVEMVFSNLALQWCDPDRAFREFMRVLRPGGLLMFTSFGPDTLRELRAAWQKVDAAPHVHPFIDMHDIGDALVRAGFADPVMDVERLTLTYPDALALLRDLKHIGAHNAAPHRHPGLTGKQHFAAFIAAYEAFRQEGLLPATYEVVYGHAWAPSQKPTSFARPDGSVSIPLDRLRRKR